MKDKPKVINRGKLIYVLYPDSITVSVGGGQYVSYNPYHNWNRQGINQFRQAILKSGDDEYASPVDQMSLAVRCGIKGTGTSKPKEIE